MEGFLETAVKVMIASICFECFFMAGVFIAIHSFTLELQPYETGSSIPILYVENQV